MSDSTLQDMEKKINELEENRPQVAGPPSIALDLAEAKRMRDDLENVAKALVHVQVLVNSARASLQMLVALGGSKRG